jgi:hypothetical protein
MDINSLLLSNLKVSSDSKWGACIKLLNWEHCDYIEDVFAEHFDLEYEFKIADDDEQRYILFFAGKATSSEVEKVVSSINEHHQQTCKLYETI